MPVSERRRPFERRDKSRVILEALAYAREQPSNVGVGFPQSTQTSPEFLLEISQACAEQGATRIVVYDTHGGSDPFATYELIRRMKTHLGIPVFFHGHNDLGMAAANAFAAARAGADGLDVTVNGLGDRAGNASLEQVAMILHLRGVRTGIRLEALARLSEAVAQESGLAVPELAPIVGAFAATHKSAGHLELPELFEAFDPSLVGLHRKVEA
jgi:homocitrate synthase NifV